MNKEKSKKRKGVLTVEAIIILPIFYVFFMFIISILNLSYYHLVMQQALINSGRTLAQYGHLVNMFIDLKELGLKEEVNEKEEKIVDDVENIKENLVGESGLTANIKNLTDDAKSIQENITGESGLKTNITNLAVGFAGDNAEKKGLIELCQTDFLNNLPTIGQRVDEVLGSFETLSQNVDSLKTEINDVNTHLDAMSDNVNAVKDSAADIGNTVKSITKEDVVNYLTSSLTDFAGGKLVQLMAGDHTSEAKADSEVFKNLKYHLYVDVETSDFILVAEYDYVLPFNLVGNFHIEQSVRVHPWIGGNNTEGLEK